MVLQNAASKKSKKVRLFKMLGYSKCYDVMNSRVIKEFREIMLIPHNWVQFYATTYKKVKVGFDLPLILF